MMFGLIIEFIGRLHLVTTNDYNIFTNYTLYKIITTSVYT
jgi:ATP-dependent protease Clp ATPase subunit